MTNEETIINEMTFDDIKLDLIKKSDLQYSIAITAAGENGQLCFRFGQEYISLKVESFYIDLGKILGWIKYLRREVNIKDDKNG